MNDSFPDIDQEVKLPTEETVKYLCESITKNLKKIENAPDGNSSLKDNIYNKITKKLEELEKIGEVKNYADTIFASKLDSYIHYLIVLQNTSASSIFISILTNICEDPAKIQYILHNKYPLFAIHRCEALDENNSQTDAQYLYNTFSLILAAIDGSEEADSFAEDLLKDGFLLKLVERQLQRDEIDDNVIAALECIAIVFQLKPNSVKEISPHFINLILRFCVSLKDTQKADEEEAAFNAYNILVLFALDEEGVKILELTQPMEMLLTAWSSKASSAIAIETCLSTSKELCHQFVVAGGIKKLFKSFNSKRFLKNRNSFSNICSILENLLTQLPDESTELSRVVAKFAEDEQNKSYRLVIAAEAAFNRIDPDKGEEEDEGLEEFQIACAVITALFGSGTIEIRTAIASGIAESKALDIGLVVDGAIVRGNALAASSRVLNGALLLSALK